MTEVVNRNETYVGTMPWQLQTSASPTGWDKERQDLLSTRVGKLILLMLFVIFPLVLIAVLVYLAFHDGVIGLVGGCC